MVIVVLLMWIGSAIAGWQFYWPWLVVPPGIVGLHILRVTGQMNAVRRRNGMSLPRLGEPGSMLRPNLTLLILTVLQHLCIFGIAAGAHRLFG